MSKLTVAERILTDNQTSLKQTIKEHLSKGPIDLSTFIDYKNQAIREIRITTLVNFLSFISTIATTSYIAFDVADLIGTRSVDTLQVFPGSPVANLFTGFLLTGVGIGANIYSGRLLFGATEALKALNEMDSKVSFDPNLP